MAATDLWWNGRPFSLTKPWAASSADIARRLSRPPLGFLRASVLARATTSGRSSAWLLRPSTFAPVSRFLAVARAAQLRDQHGLLELRDAAEDLSDHHAVGRVVEEAAWTVGGDQRDPGVVQQTPARLLHDQVAGEARSPSRR